MREWWFYWWPVVFCALVSASLWFGSAAVWWPLFIPATLSTGILISEFKEVRLERREEE